MALSEIEDDDGRSYSFEEQKMDPTIKCLIANDDPTQLLCLRLVSENAGLKVTTAVNGFEAFQIV